MGWNSWDNFATTVTEAETKAHADVMARDLKAHGWEYVVVDIQWYEPGAESHAYRQDAILEMDEYGRLQPAPNRFPSAADGNGFTDLAAYVHEKGLKFGVHLMRGIPRQAVEKNLAVFGTEYHAQDIANTDSICPWNPDMYGVDMSKPGAQAYYDSVFQMVADWGVDYVKVDDISRPYFEHYEETEAIRKAIDKTGRPMVLSLSPGATVLEAAEHVSQHANLWRISDDFWDRWLAVDEQFTRLRKWSKTEMIPGAWPDADMLPFGVLDLNKRRTRFTQDEQLTVMTLWCIARSPLMMGGDLTMLDPFTLSLLTNDEVIAVNQESSNNRELFNDDGLIAWIADVPNSDDKYLALFNSRDRMRSGVGFADFDSGVLTADSPKEHEVELDLHEAKKLILRVNSEVDAPAPDRIFWNEPTLIFADGTSRPLSAYPWSHADATWDSVSINRDKNGDSLGFASLTPSVIEFELPSDVSGFTAKAVVGNWNQDAGGSIRFLATAGRAEDEGPALGLPIQVAFDSLGFSGSVSVRDLWKHQELGMKTDSFSPVIPYHGTALYRISPSSQ